LAGSSRRATSAIAAESTVTAVIARADNTESILFWIFDGNRRAKVRFRTAKTNVTSITRAISISRAGAPVERPGFIEIGASGRAVRILADAIRVCIAVHAESLVAGGFTIAGVARRVILENLGTEISARCLLQVSRVRVVTVRDNRGGAADNSREHTAPGDGSGKSPGQGIES